MAFGRLRSRKASAPRGLVTAPRIWRWRICSNKACACCAAIIDWPAGRTSAEIDLILLEPDGTLVFVEVRARRDSDHGGAAGSVSLAKRRRIVRAAQHYLLGLTVLPACRFDVVAIEGDALQWLRAAFDS